MKRSLSLLLALCLCFLAGCELPEEKQIQCQELTMTVPGSFLDLSYLDNGCTFYYGYETQCVTGQREDASLYATDYPDMTVEEYAWMVVSCNDLDCQVEMRDDVPTFTYQMVSDDTTYTFVAGAYQGSDAFWLVQFQCEESEADQMLERFYEYLLSVQIS